MLLLFADWSYDMTIFGWFFQQDLTPFWWQKNSRKIFVFILKFVSIMWDILDWKLFMSHLQFLNILHRVIKNIGFRHFSLFRSPAVMLKAVDTFLENKLPNFFLIKIIHIRNYFFFCKDTPHARLWWLSKEKNAAFR